MYIYIYIYIYIWLVLGRRQAGSKEAGRSI